MLNGPEPETVATGFEELFEAAEAFDALVPAPFEGVDPVSALTIMVTAKRPARSRYTLCASATNLNIGSRSIFFRKFRPLRQQLGPMILTKQPMLNQFLVPGC